MRPDNLQTRIFLDGGNPEETRDSIRILGFLDGQTTNPTLISKNPEAKERLSRGEKFSEREMLSFYRDVVTEISGLIAGGSVSVEVYADASTKAEAMFAQGKEMFSWIPNAHIKFPLSHEGLKAAEQAVKYGLRVNMTLCFTQEQAAAVYAATRVAKKADVFVSPFVGRLDDRGENGMDLIANIIRMYSNGDHHVEVLTASVRSIEHLFYAIALGSDIVTVPYKILQEWEARDLPLPDQRYKYETKGLKIIPYKDLDLSEPWKKFNISHDLTVKGMENFSSDWNLLIAQ